MSGAHGHVEHGGNKGIALLISVLALVLAISEMLGKSAQTQAIVANVEASSLWSFFQAKTIRQTIARTAAEAMRAEAGEKLSPAAQRQIENWLKTVERYQSEPDTGEGRKELSERAKAAEQRRHVNLAAYHNYEVASAAVQIAIVMASASIITTIPALAWIAGALGAAAVVFCAIGMWVPTAVHLF